MELKTARIAWNNNGWVKPSGKNGKPDKKDYKENSKNKPPFEAIHGYGHEEWLFDTGKIIDGFRHGFLQSINTENNKYSNKMFTIYLYTINNKSKKRYFVGKISNVIVLDNERANKIHSIYKKNGWLSEMNNQIIDVGGESEIFKENFGIKIFNIKFNPNDCFINDPIIELPKQNRVYTISRYSLAPYKFEFDQISLNNYNFEFSPSEPPNYGGKETKKRNVESKSIEIEYIHKKISKSLYKYLCSKYGKSNVAVEHNVGYGGNKIDIVLNNEIHNTFFEIKTYSSVKTSIREAVGQLIEYCYFPIEKRANELIIVSHLPETDEIKEYMEHLRNVLNINIFYQYYDMNNNILSEKC
jgi:nitrate reductase NapAB chaperone NapD